MWHWAQYWLISFLVLFDRPIYMLGDTPVQVMFALELVVIVGIVFESLARCIVDPPYFLNHRLVFFNRLEVPYGRPSWSSI